MNLFFPEGKTGYDNGLSHADDLFYLFDDPKAGFSGLESEEAKATAGHVMTMWTNFAKYGDPTPFQDEDIPSWTKFGKEGNFMIIKEEPEISNNIKPERMFFWDKMFFGPAMSQIRSREVPVPVISPSVYRHQHVPFPIRGRVQGWILIVDRAQNITKISMNTLMFIALPNWNKIYS